MFAWICPPKCPLNKYVGMISCVCRISLELETCCRRKTSSFLLDYCHSSSSPCVYAKCCSRSAGRHCWADMSSGCCSGPVRSGKHGPPARTSSTDLQQCPAGLEARSYALTGFTALFKFYLSQFYAFQTMTA